MRRALSKEDHAARRRLEKELGKRMRAARIAAGISPSVMAAIVGMGQYRYEDHERGEIALALFRMHRFAKAVGVDMGILLTGLPD